MYYINILLSINNSQEFNVLNKRHLMYSFIVAHICVLNSSDSAYIKIPTTSTTVITTTTTTTTITTTTNITTSTTITTITTTPVQYSLFRRTTTVPTELREVLKKETFDKARLYQIENKRFSFFSNLYHQIELTVRICLRFHFDCE